MIKVLVFILKILQLVVGHVLFKTMYQELLYWHAWEWG